jgi:hypothetical protein
LTQLSEIKPPGSSIIGYVTTGHFSLSQGEGFAIGAISVVRLLELQEQSHRLARSLFILRFHCLIGTFQAVPKCDIQGSATPGQGAQWQHPAISCCILGDPRLIAIVDLILKSEIQNNTYPVVFYNRGDG